MGTLTVCLSLAAFCISLVIAAEYTNQFAIHVEPGVDVDQLAFKYGLVNKGQIGSLKDHYLLEHPHVHRRSTEYAHHHHQNLRTHSGVLWVEQQQIKKRVKKDIEKDSTGGLLTTSPSSTFSDPLFTKQWYINHGARGGFDMNTQEAWAMGYTGKRVVVTILDDGIQRDHPDLQINYDPKASYDINDNDPDPTPQDNGDNKHGTRCAGEVAAQAFNDFCGVGIAYNASIGGVRMLDGTVTDHVEAKALSLNPDHIDIYSASWGPEDDGKTIDGPGKLAKKAFIDGIRQGRGGRGSIFVWASGNGGRKQDNCNCDGYTNSIYTLSISSATQSGSKPWYLEECSSTLATTYSSGSPGSDQNIVTVDMDTTYRKTLHSGEPITQYLCTLSHTGTSASAPIAAGIVALALEANPYLTWRDMQHLVVLTSRYEGLRWEGGWQVNAVGRRYSHKFGYGLMDAAAMVRLAKVWKNVAPQRLCESESVSSNKDSVLQIPPDNTPLNSQIFTTGCKGTSNEIRYLEHVQATITLKFHPRGNLKITLTSPSGTSSTLLLPRMRDAEDDVIQNWPFLSVHFWGETVEGYWKLSIQNMAGRAERPGVLVSWSLTFYGTLDKPPSGLKNVSSHHLPRRTYSTATFDDDQVSECRKSGQFSLPGSIVCLDKCPNGYFDDRASGICQKCSSSCSTCYGPSSENCLTCPNGTFYYSDKCINICPKGYFAHESLTECLPCSSNCKSCSNSPKYCTECANGFILDETSHICILNCQNGKSDDIDGGTRVVTAAGGNCGSCHSTCVTCYGPRDYECISCPPSHRLIHGKCIEASECPDGYFTIAPVGTSSPTVTIECFKCHPSCRTCNGSSHSDCLECNESFTRINGLCSHCAPGQYLDKSSSSSSSSSSSPVKSSTSNLCSPCHETCLECSGPNENDCIRCFEPALFLQQGKCLPCCSKINSHSSRTSNDDDDGNNSITNNNANAMRNEGSTMNSGNNNINNNNNVNSVNVNCCYCLNETIGPCATQQFARSVSTIEYSPLSRSKSLHSSFNSYDDSINGKNSYLWSKPVIFGTVVAFCAFILVISIVAFTKSSRHKLVNNSLNQLNQRQNINNKQQLHWSDIFSSTKSKTDLGYSRLNIDDLEEESLFQRT